MKPDIEEEEEEEEEKEEEGEEGEEEEEVDIYWKYSLKRIDRSLLPHKEASHRRDKGYFGAQ